MTCLLIKIYDHFWFMLSIISCFLNSLTLNTNQIGLLLKWTRNFFSKRRNKWNSLKQPTMQFENGYCHSWKHSSKARNKTPLFIKIVQWRSFLSRKLFMKWIKILRLYWYIDIDILCLYFYFCYRFLCLNQL